MLADTSGLGVANYKYAPKQQCVVVQNRGREKRKGGKAESILWCCISLLQMCRNDASQRS